jgi:regulator of protease activity HflC (stomatin/prohibitin superfamily)
MIKRKGDVGAEVLVVIIIVIAIFGLIAGFMWGLPHYKVYRAKLTGEASLREAESSKKIRIEDAKAKEESAKLEARAEVERAKGLAEAIEIVGKAAQQYPEYRHQRFIDAYAHAIEEGKIDHMIYVPTEAGIPITEAGRVVKDHPGLEP